MSTHQYYDDGTKDWAGEGRCADCGLPRANRRHDLRPRTDEQRQLDERRMGEDRDV